MNTGKRNPLHLPADEQYDNFSTQLISCKLVHNQNKHLFPAFNSSNNFVTIDYKAHINTESDYPINHVFKTMSIAELNTLHTTCEVERTQLLTSLAMSVKKTKLAGFLLTQNHSNLLSKDQLSGSMIVLTTCLFYTYLINVMTKSQLIILTLSCMLTLSLVKPLNTLIKYRVNTTHKMLLLLILINTMF